MSESPASMLPDAPSTSYSPTRSPKRKKRFGVALLIIGMTVAVVGIMWNRGEPSTLPPTSSSPSPTSTHEPEDSIVRVVATGDMIPHDALNAAAKQTNGSYDYFPFMADMKPYFDAAQIRFCNQAVLGAGSTFGITGYPIFNAPTEFTRDMQKVGCNVINTGSNHSNDKSQAALDASIAVWDTLPDVLAVAGANRSEAEKQKVRYFEIDGIKFAFLSYTTYLNTPNKTSYSVTLFEETLVKKQLQAARAQADIVLVSMRWGTEYSDQVNASQATQSQFLATHGADIVVGHGPHVLQPVKKLKGQNGRNTYVWYSLGNFLNAQVEASSLINGFAVMDIDKSSKHVTNIGYLPVYVHYEWSAQQKAREDLMARKNFKMYLLEDAGDILTQSHLRTTVSAQQKRLKTTLNTYTEVPLLSKQQYLSR